MSETLNREKVQAIADLIARRFGGVYTSKAALWDTALHIYDEHIAALAAAQHELEVARHQRDSWMAEANRHSQERADAQREIERLRANAIEADEATAKMFLLAQTLRDEMEGHAEQAEAQVRALRGALTELHALIEEGWLVRNTVNDGHFPSYLKESARLVNALAAAQKALALATPPAPTEPAP